MIKSDELVSFLSKRCQSLGSIWLEKTDCWIINLKKPMIRMILFRKTYAKLKVWNFFNDKNSTMHECLSLNNQKIMIIATTYKLDWIFKLLWYSKLISFSLVFFNNWLVFQVQLKKRFHKQSWRSAPCTCSSKRIKTKIIRNKSSINRQINENSHKNFIMNSPCHHPSSP